jgi:photosystem II stability/assembly factor-like uncharacterized protein
VECRWRRSLRWACLFPGGRPLRPRDRFCGRRGGVFKSTDGGASWSGKLLAASVYSLVFFPQRPTTIVAADYDRSFYYNSGSHIYASRDGGANWTQRDCPTDISPGALAIDPTNPSTLYSGGIGRYYDAYPGIFKTVDSGLTWTQASLGIFTALVIDPQNPSTIYAAHGGGFIRSMDGGVSWNDFNTGWNRPTTWVTFLAIDRTGTRLLAGTDYGEVFRYQISPGVLDLSVTRGP